MATNQKAPLPHAYGRVLVVDDDPDARQLMQDHLERRGFEVITVESGADALAYLAQDTPGLILLDLEMNDMNGWEVMTLLKRHPRFGSFQVVVVTGSSGTVPKWAAHLKKPFRIDALMGLLENQARSPRMP